jgi:hypothetical protein
VQTLVSRRPEPLQPTTSVVEWDAKGQRAVRALIALVSSNFGHGVSGMAQVGAGRIAVTEHITDPSAGECRIRARGRRKGHVDPGGLLMGRSVDQDRDRWIAWSLHGRSPVGSERPGCTPTFGSGDLVRGAYYEASAASELVFWG